ncbi:hypothetical protein TNCV_5096961 [Trichonephila clavipes]|nr:hypothetical protein TNCV_5096961 [Trichonephila clavipes]
MTKKETKPKEKPESPKLRDERHHSFPPEKNKEKEKIFFAGKSARRTVLKFAKRIPFIECKSAAKWDLSKSTPKWRCRELSGVIDY